MTFNVHIHDSAKTTKKALTRKEPRVILSKRVCESAWAQIAMKREIARRNRGNFRGVCPVSGVYPIRNRAAETEPVYAYIAGAESQTG